jgi:hypothetical protein
MADPDLDLLRTAIKRRWSWGPSQKAKGYVNAFSAADSNSNFSFALSSGLLMEAHFA